MKNLSGVGSPCGVLRNLNAGKNSTNKKKKKKGMLRSHRTLTANKRGTENARFPG